DRWPAPAPVAPEGRTVRVPLAGPADEQGVRAPPPTAPDRPGTRNLPRPGRLRRRGGRDRFGRPREPRGARARSGERARPRATARRQRPTAVPGRPVVPCPCDGAGGPRAGTGRARST